MGRLLTHAAGECACVKRTKIYLTLHLIVGGGGCKFKFYVPDVGILPSATEILSARLSKDLPVGYVQIQNPGAFLS